MCSVQTAGGSENGLPTHHLAASSACGTGIPSLGSQGQLQQRPVRCFSAGPSVLCDITNLGINVAEKTVAGLLRAASFQPPERQQEVGCMKMPLMGAPELARRSSTASAGTGVALELPGSAPADVPMDVDVEGDPEDPQNVSEYIADIYSILERDEASFQPRPDYMHSQTEINGKMRSILVDWLVEVHMKYKLKAETLFLSVGLLDRFLERRPILRRHLQLAGVAAMLMAAKYEEIYPPEVRDFVYITDNAYSREQILDMEATMLNALGFTLRCPTAANFLDRYARLNRCSEQHRHLMQYVLELSLLDLNMLRFPPSQQAAAAVFLSNKLLKQQPAWPATVARHSPHNEAAVKSCAREMCYLVEGAERSTLQAVPRKFAQPKFSSVSKMAF